MHHVTSVFVLVVVAYSATSGCRSLLSRPHKQTLEQFTAIDAIVLDDGERSVRIDEPAVIQRIYEIYASARWKPYIATFPASTLGISGFHQDRRLFKLSYCGTLIEHVNNDLRYADLSGDDLAWMNRLESESFSR